MHPAFKVSMDKLVTVLWRLTTLAVDYEFVEVLGIKFYYS